MAFQLRAARLDQEIEAHAVDQFHDEIRFFLGGQAVLEGLHDVLVLQAHADGAFGGRFRPGKRASNLAVFSLSRSFRQTVRPDLAIAGAPDLRHAPLAGAAEQLEALVDVDDREAVFVWRTGL